MSALKANCRGNTEEEHHLGLRDLATLPVAINNKADLEMWIVDNSWILGLSQVTLSALQLQILCFCVLQSLAPIFLILKY